MRGRISPKDPLAWLVLTSLVGLVWRLAFFFSDRGFYCDESKLAVNVLDRGFLDLLQPLSLNQAAPIGFLWLSKSAHLLLGSSEQALRIVPLLVSLGIVIVVTVLAWKVWQGWVAVVAVFLVSANVSLLDYAQVFKQYNFDVLAFSLTTLLLYLSISDRGRTRLAAVLVLPFLLIPFSHQAAFFSVSALAVLWLHAIRNRDRERLIIISVAGVIWLVFQLLSARFLSGGSMDSHFLERYWLNAGGFPRHDVMAYLRWLTGTPVRVFSIPYEYGYNLLPGIPLIGLGIYWWVRRKPWLSLFLGLVMMACLTGASLHLYPFGGDEGRLVLFGQIFLILSISPAPLVLRQFITRPALAYPLTLALGSLVLIPQAYYFRQGVFEPYVRNGLKELLLEVDSQIEEGDFVYSYYGAKSVMIYYDRFLPSSRPQVFEGSSSEDFPSELRQFTDEARIWIITSFYCNGTIADIEPMIDVLRDTHDLVGNHGYGASLILLFSKRPGANSLSEGAGFGGPPD